MAISKEAAEAVLLEEAAKASGTEFDAGWVAQVERLSRACEDAPKTHIAYLGTAMLAKAVDLGVDVLALKAKSPIPGEPPPPGAFSARTLCHGVLVPHATELGINLGVTGREPLNNQPYFRMIRIDDGTPVHGNSRVAFAILREILDQLAQVQTEAEARAALRAFIRVRRQAQPDYAAMIEGAAVPVGVLVGMVATFVVADEADVNRREQRKYKCLHHADQQFHHHDGHWQQIRTDLIHGIQKAFTAEDVAIKTEGERQEARQNGNNFNEPDEEENW